MRFPDTVTVYEPDSDAYGDTVRAVSTTLNGLFVQSSGYSYLGGRPATTSQSVVYLEDSTYLQDIDYALEGYAIAVKGVDYRVNSVDVGRQLLLGGQVKHVELGLSRI